MNNVTKWIVGIIVVLLVVWGIVASQKNKNLDKMASPNPTPASQDQNKMVAGDTYKVGVILPLTGDAASYGEPGKNIIQLAIDEINNAGMTNGKKLELDFQDGKCNGQDATNAMQKLVNVDKVQAVIGGFCSSESLAADPVAESSKVAMISPGSSSPKLTGVGIYFVRNYPSDASQGTVIADVAYNQKGYKKVAFIQEQTDYATGIYTAFKAEFEKLGGTVTKQEFASKDTDFRTQLAKIKTDNPDAVFLDTQTPATAGRVLKQIQDLKWKPHLFVSDIIPPDAATVTTYKTLLEGAIGAEYGLNNTTAKYQHLVDAYKQLYKIDLPYPSYAQAEYDAPFIIRDAIAAVGYDGTKIAQWLRTSVQNWDGASGSVTIGSNGDLVGGHKPVVIMGGKMVPMPQ